MSPRVNICVAHSVDWCEVCLTDEAFGKSAESQGDTLALIVRYMRRVIAATPTHAGISGSLVAQWADALERAPIHAKPRELRTTDPDVIACMGSEPICIANGCQAPKMAYRDGEGPEFELRDGHLEDVRKAGDRSA